MIRYRVIETEWGLFGFVWGRDGLLGTYLPERGGAGSIRRLTRDWPHARESERGMAWLTSDVRDYFRGKEVEFDVELDLADMTDFRRAVTQACADIPLGETVSYADLAARAGRPGASRAAGSVMAKNPFPLIVPCHRVIAGDGSLGGFSSADGVSQKERLLTREGVSLDHRGRVPIMG